MKQVCSRVATTISSEKSRHTLGTNMFCIRLHKVLLYIFFASCLYCIKKHNLSNQNAEEYLHYNLVWKCACSMLDWGRDFGITFLDCTMVTACSKTFCPLVKLPWFLHRRGTSALTQFFKGKLLRGSPLFLNCRGSGTG